jgi:hypothetical protein
MSASPELRKSHITQLATSQSFDRGKAYFDNGAIENPVRQGNTIWADCHGTEVYYPRATLANPGIESSSCTCPYDWDGLCKHQVALLLAYLYEPAEFQVVPPMQKLLAKRSRDDLIEMIEQMVKRHPELMALVQMPEPPAVGEVPDLASYQRQVTQLFQGDEMHPMARELETLANHGKILSDSGDWLHAGEIYQLLLAAANTHYNYTVLEVDYNGEVGSVIQTIAEGLSDSLGLGETLDADQRRQWVETLFNAVLKDIALGGMDYAYPARDAIADQTIAEDWVWLEPRLRQEIEKAAQNSFSDWAQEQLVKLLTAGGSRRGADQTADDILLELGTPRQQAFFHLEQSNLAEAIAIARANFNDLPGLVKQFADRLLELQAPELALDFVQACAGERYSYADWLAQFHQTQGNTEQFLQAQVALLNQSFTLDGYRTLQAEAAPLGQWKTLRQSLHQSLTQQKRYGSLIDIALWEQDWQAAQRYLQHLRPWDKQKFQEKVATQIKTDEPETAIAFYRELIEQAIEERGRDNYRRAARFLKTIQPLYAQLHQTEMFQAYVAQLRKTNSRLPALKEELHKVGL